MDLLKKSTGAIQGGGSQYIAGTVAVIDGGLWVILSSPTLNQPPTVTVGDGSAYMISGGPALNVPSIAWS